MAPRNPIGTSSTPSTKAAAAEQVSYVLANRSGSHLGKVYAT
jgi:hypothetical protein